MGRNPGAERLLPAIPMVPAGGIWVRRKRQIPIRTAIYTARNSKMKGAQCHVNSRSNEIALKSALRQLYEIDSIMSTYRAVKAEIAKLEKQASDLFKKEMDVVLSKVRALISEYGLTAADLGFAGKAGKAAKTTRVKAVAAKTAGVPKYVDPASGKTWTGKGKPPTWIAQALKSGKSKDEFLILKAQAAPVAEVKAAKVEKAAKPAKAAKVARAAELAKPAKKSAAPKPAKKAVAKTAAKKPVAKAAEVQADVTPA
jgi:DNA-binding protein H-NS